MTAPIDELLFGLANELKVLQTSVDIYAQHAKDVHPRITELETRIDHLNTKLDIIMETLIRSETAINTFIGAVMPTIESLSDHPMVKMLGVK